MTSELKSKAAYRCHVKSGDLEFVQLLEEGFFQGTIHSIFERTINVTCLENDELYTIAVHTLDNGPNTLITDLDSCSTLELAVGDRIFSDTKCIKVENKLNISISQIASWQCVLPDFPADTQQLKSNLIEANLYISEKGTSGGIKKSLNHDNIIQTELARMLEERTQGTLKQLSMGRWDSAKAKAIQLIGLGPGLTPSGDDFLTGLFTVFHMPNGQLWSNRSFCMEIASHASELTNQISCITLKKAATGNVRECIVNFLEAAAYGSTTDTLNCLAAVLKIGSSSGTDIALGIIRGLELNLNTRWR